MPHSVASDHCLLSCYMFPGKNGLINMASQNILITINMKSLTCFWSPISMANDVSIEDRAFGTNADVSSSRWLFIKTSLTSGRLSTLRGKLYFFSALR